MNYLASLVGFAGLFGFEHISVEAIIMRRAPVFGFLNERLETFVVNQLCLYLFSARVDFLLELLETWAALSELFQDSLHLYSLVVLHSFTHERTELGGLKLFARVVYFGCYRLAVEKVGGVDVKIIDACALLQVRVYFTASFTLR